MERWIMGSILTLMLFGIACPFGYSQSYKMELGMAVGGSFYMGDANQRDLFKELRPSWNLLYRYNLNGRFSLKGMAGFSGVAGSTQGMTTNFPSGVSLSFDRNLADVGVQIEWNFYEYGMPSYVPGSMLVTPYVCTGVGVLGYKTDKLSVGMYLPVGVGLKAKLYDRFNVGCEWSFRKTNTDRLDYFDNGGSFQLTDPWLTPSSRNKNKDWFSLFTVNLSVDLFPTGTACFRN